jgi:hypothetical protein
VLRHSRIEFPTGPWPQPHNLGCSDRIFNLAAARNLECGLQTTSAKKLRLCNRSASVQALWRCENLLQHRRRYAFSKQPGTAARLWRTRVTASGYDGGWLIRPQRLGADAVVALAREQDESRQIAQGIDKRHDLGRQSAARLADGLILSPPYGMARPSSPS